MLKNVDCLDRSIDVCNIYICRRMWDGCVFVAPGLATISQHQSIRREKRREISAANRRRLLERRGGKKVDKIRRRFSLDVSWLSYDGRFFLGWWRYGLFPVGADDWFKTGDIEREFCTESVQMTVGTSFRQDWARQGRWRKEFITFQRKERTPEKNKKNKEWKRQRK